VVPGVENVQQSISGGVSMQILATEPAVVLEALRDGQIRLLLFSVGSIDFGSRVGYA
jgi:hypothetical protein